MMSRRNDDPTPIPEDEDPEDEQFTDGRLEVQLEADLDNLSKGS